MNYRRTFEQGISLVEVLLVATIIGFLVIIIASLPNALSLMGKSGRISLAREIATKTIEEKRQLTYANLSYGEEAISDARLGKLPAGSGKSVVTDCDVAICAGGESVKLLEVTVKWAEGQDFQEVKLETFVAEDGLK